MAATVFPCKKYSDSSLMGTDLSMTFNDDGYYWHLFQYFEKAKLPGQYELIDLYSDGEINGYELKRLSEILDVVEQDINWRPSNWQVTVGWQGEVGEETEINRTVEKVILHQIIQQLKTLIAYCFENNLVLCVDSD